MSARRGAGSGTPSIDESDDLSRRSSFSQTSVRTPGGVAGGVYVSDVPEWTSTNAPMSPMQGFEDGHLFSYSPVDTPAGGSSMNDAGPASIGSFATPTTSGTFRAPLEGMVDLDVDGGNSSMITIEADGVLRDSEKKKSIWGTLARDTVKRDSPKGSPLSSSSSPSKSNRPPAVEALSYSRRKRNLHFLCVFLSFTGAVVCLALVIKEIVDASASKGDVTSRDSVGVDGRPECDFVGQLQPNVFLECDCYGRVGTFSDEVLLRYKSLQSQWIEAILPGFDEKIDSCSSVNLALAWLATDTYHQTNDEEEQERFGLALLYAAWGGLGWRYVQNWLDPTKSMCEWHGVKCSSSGSLHDLSLNDNGIKGTIPTEVAVLTSLRTLSLAYNRIEGTLPSEFGGMHSIESIRLSVNSVGGRIPTELAMAKKLKTLELDFNGLTGSFPAELATLSHLDHIGLWENKLEGRLPPEIGNFVSLRELKIHANAFTGFLPTEIGNLGNLTVINLARNDLRGPIPSEMGKLSHLRAVDLAHAGISGPIPSELGKCAVLETLSLGENELDGTIPTELGELRLLMFLFLFDNLLTGKIPVQLGHLTAMTQFKVQSNKLTGTVPKQLGRCDSLETLDFTKNLLVGTVPSEVCDLRTENLIHFFSDCLLDHVQCPVPDCCTDCSL